MLEYPADWTSAGLGDLQKGDVIITPEGFVRISDAYIHIPTRTRRYVRKVRRMVLASQLLQNLKETNKCKS